MERKEWDELRTVLATGSGQVSERSMNNHGLFISASDKDNAAMLIAWAEGDQILVDILQRKIDVKKTAAREITTQKKAIERWRAVQDE